MWSNEHEQERRFRAAWEAVAIRRPVHYSLFTFGESVLPYFLVLSASKPGETVSLTQGAVRITRPTIITPDNTHPEFSNFFDDADDERLVQFLLAHSRVFAPPAGQFQRTQADGQRQRRRDCQQAQSPAR